MSDRVLDEILTEDIVAQEELSDTQYMRIGEVTPLHILSFAKWILLGLAIIFVLACVIEVFFPKNAVFEACKLTLPSLATLVIGYYFGTTKS